MKAILSALVCGLVFGAGLLISGMTEPTKVLGFLDIFGDWDPSLAIVMAVALVVAGIGFALIRPRPRPVFALQSLWPTKTAIDTPLLAGSVLFGVGWGLVGLCPGPALEDLSTGAPEVILFCLAMALGMIGQNLWQKQKTPPAPAGKEPVLEASCG